MQYICAIRSSIVVPVGLAEGDGVGEAGGAAVGVAVGVAVGEAAWMDPYGEMRSKWLIINQFL